MTFPDLDALFQTYGTWWYQQQGGTCTSVGASLTGYEDQALSANQLAIVPIGQPQFAVKQSYGSPQTVVNTATDFNLTQDLNLSLAVQNTSKWATHEGFKTSLTVKGTVAAAEVGVTAEVKLQRRPGGLDAGPPAAGV